MFLTILNPCLDPRVWICGCSYLYGHEHSLPSPQHTWVQSCSHSMAELSQKSGVLPAAPPSLGEGLWEGQGWCSQRPGSEQTAIGRGSSASLTGVCGVCKVVLGDFTAERLDSTGERLTDRQGAGLGASLFTCVQRGRQSLLQGQVTEGLNRYSHTELTRRSPSCAEATWRWPQWAQHRAWPSVALVPRQRGRALGSEVKALDGASGSALQPQRASPRMNWEVFVRVEGAVCLAPMVPCAHCLLSAAFTCT